MDINRKQFIGSLVALAVTPTFAIDSRTEFERCKDDILYFVDKYLVVKDHLGNAIQLSPEQREYLKRVSETKEILVCEKARQVGITTANNVFAYWKNLFFPGHKVWIVEPSMAMAKRAGELFANVSNTGGFQLDPDRIHFVSPHASTCVDLHDRNNTFILDEYDWWEFERQTPFAYEIVYRMNYSRMLEKNEPMEHQFEYAPFIIPSTPVHTKEHFVFPNLHFFLHDSRYMVIPSPISGLEA